MSSTTPSLEAHSVEAARACICAAVPAALPAERVALHAAAGRTLAEDLTAPRDQPPFRASAMDGYAVRWADLAPATSAGAAPAAAGLAIIGEAPAGRAGPGRVAPGEAVRIFTGAPVPGGADAVVPQERAQRTPAGRLVVEAAYAARIERGANIRACGVDFPAGARLLGRGTRLTARDLALIAAAGVGTVAVRRRPRIALMANGSELRAPGEPAGPFEIYDSVTYGLGAMLEDWGAHVVRVGTASDRESAIAAAVRRATVAAQADALVVVGGASVGDYDLVKRTLASLGLELRVAAVAIRPGKPTWFGALGGLPDAPPGGLPVLGLPGNPAAAFVCAQLFARALIETLLGGASGSELATAVLEERLPATGAQESYVRARARLGADARLTVMPDPRQDTSLVSVYAASNALIRRPAGSPAAPQGALVDVLLLDKA